MLALTRVSIATVTQALLVTAERVGGRGRDGEDCGKWREGGRAGEMEWPVVEGKEGGLERKRAVAGRENGCVCKGCGREGENETFEEEGRAVVREGGVMCGWREGAKDVSGAGKTNTP